MTEATKQMVREWVAKDSGNKERTARWMAREIGVGPLKECRQMVKEAMQS